MLYHIILCCLIKIFNNSYITVSYRVVAFTHVNGCNANFQSEIYVTVTTESWAFYNVQCTIVPAQFGGSAA